MYQIGRRSLRDYSTDASFLDGFREIGEEKIIISSLQKRNNTHLNTEMLIDQIKTKAVIIRFISFLETTVLYDKKMNMRNHVV